MHYDISPKNEFLLLTKFFKKPKIIGSIFPSSKYLAKKMLQHVQWDKVNSIVELGAGTGVFTRCIYKLRNNNCPLFIFEIEDEMRKNIKKQFPNSKICKDARYLSKVLSENNLSGCDSIISGLPFAVFSKIDREIIINEIVNSLNKNGVFITFQYSLQMKKTLVNKFSRVDITFEPRNIPPAFVYTCYK